MTLTLRDSVHAADVAAVRAIVTATGFFSPQEATVAGELVEERLARGPASGYQFVFTEDADGLAGYVCFGPIPLTVASYDLYWIVVRPDLQRGGLGRRLLLHVETEIVRLGGMTLYADTSSRPQYAPTRAFYRRAGFAPAAELPDFYAPGDSRIIFAKRLLSVAS